MPMPFEWQIGWRHVRAGRFGGPGRNRFVAFIAAVSMAGITLGVAALIVVLSVINGFQREVRDRMLGAIAHVELSAASGGVLADVPGLLATLRRDADAQAAAPVISRPTLLGRGEVLRGALVRGIDPASEPVTDLVRTLPAPLRAALQPGSRQIVLGRALATALGAKAGDALVMLRPGDAGSSAPRYVSYTVAGTFDAGHYEFDNGLSLVHLADAGEAFELAGASGIELRLRDAQQAPRVADRLAMQLGPAVIVRDWTRSNRLWFESVQIQKRMIALILVLIVAVAAFNLVSTLVMAVADKRAEIAILRTLGASPASVMAIFVVQGAAVGLIGTAAGVALGLAIASNIDVLVPALERLAQTRFLDPSIYFLDHMPSQPLAADVVPIAMVSIVLALVATLYPSWRASRVDPAQALRYE
ncbi:MAG: lipoprotein-releasing ABC transporter permease subunit [Rubrivivax sp.]|nr:lipoprotein-releasing ABC transporter permease subunit [Rubrivivax sp.]